MSEMDCKLRFPSTMSWDELVVRSRLGSFEKALLYHNTLVGKCDCVGSIRAMRPDEWLRLPWMDARTHDNVVKNIRAAALAELT